MGGPSLNEVRAQLVEWRVLESAGRVRFTKEFEKALKRASKAGAVHGPKGHRRESNAAELQVAEALQRFLPARVRASVRPSHRSFVLAVHSTSGEN